MKIGHMMKLVAVVLAGLTLTACLTSVGPGPDYLMAHGIMARVKGDLKTSIINYSLAIDGGGLSREQESALPRRF